MSFTSVQEFEEKTIEKGIALGVLYQQKHSKKSNQFYMRCSFHRKKHPQGHLFNCQAFLYATIVNNKLVLKKLNPYHSHQLLTSEDIKLQLKQSRKSIQNLLKRRLTNYL